MGSSQHILDLCTGILIERRQASFQNGIKSSQMFPHSTIVTELWTLILPLFNQSSYYLAGVNKLNQENKKIPHHISYAIKRELKFPIPRLIKHPRPEVAALHNFRLQTEG